MEGLCLWCVMLNAGERFVVKDGVVEVNGEWNEGDGGERRNGSDMEERGENVG